MVRRVFRIAVLMTPLVCTPLVVFAQATITGVVKDTSGAVLPGVTVEAASPALIEKTRAATTDGTGQYRIIDLRPGPYSVTFTLTGFSTVKREGVELTGSFTATINADMKVGALEETITVSGETPVVDVQSATRERVITAELVANLPTGRNYNNLGVTVPGVTQTGTAQDVGGSIGTPYSDLVVHGSHSDAQRVMFNGVSMMALFGSGNRSYVIPNPITFQELSMDTGASTARISQGGVLTNLIPKDGGNQFHVSSFVSYANNSMQGSNFTQNLQNRHPVGAAGLTSGPAIDHNADIEPSVGGPIIKDKLWFTAAGRFNPVYNYVPGMFYNANFNNPALFTYVPDKNRPAILETTISNLDARVTWQVTPRNKFAITLDNEKFNPFPAPSPTASPEAVDDSGWHPNWWAALEWSSPVTNRLLLDAVYVYQYGIRDNPVDAWNYVPGLNNVSEQGGIIPGLSYRAVTQFTGYQNPSGYYRLGLSYVSGAHAFKTGWNDAFGYRDQWNYLGNLLPYSMRFRNGVPNLITEFSAPAVRGTYTGHTGQDQAIQLNHEGGFFVEDKWTLSRWTFNLGARYDIYANSYPQTTVGPAQLAPRRNITFPQTDGLNYKDFTPRFNAVWDVFGDGKTAVRASLNKYLAGIAISGFAQDLAPANRLVTSTTRSWNDTNAFPAGDARNGNFVPDCDLLNPAANGECGAMANPAFGGVNATTTTIDPNAMTGWNKRNANWEFGLGIQQQLLPRVSVDAGYYRRWYEHFSIIDNLTVPASGYSQFNITAPIDAGLPNGGGYAVNGVVDVNPQYFGILPNLYETIDSVSNYGSQFEHWNGVDVSVNARLTNGVLVQGGVSTGKTLLDNCQIAAQDPELLGFVPPGAQFLAGSFVPAAAQTPLSFCRQETPWLTQVKIVGSYAVPKVDVRVSATYQSVPGPQLSSGFLVSNAAVQAALGRGISGGNANSTINVNIIPPGSLFGDRINQLDMRFAKLLKFGRTRNSLAIDVYNVFNSDAVITENANYASFRVPLTVMQPRFAKLSWQFDF